MTDRTNDTPRSSEAGQGDAPGADPTNFPCPPSFPDFPDLDGLPAWLQSDAPDLSECLEQPPSLADLPIPKLEIPDLAPIDPPQEMFPPSNVQRTEAIAPPMDSMPQAPKAPRTVFEPAPITVPLSEIERLRADEPVLPPSVSEVEEETSRVRSEHSVRIPRKPKNQATVFGITVRNTRSHTIYDFSIEHDLLPGVSVQDTQPVAERQGDTLIWKFGTVEPGQRLQARVKGIPIGTGEMPPEALFRVDYSTTPPVQRPPLTLRVTAPEAIPVGEIACLKIEVAANEGSSLGDLVCKVCLPGALNDGAIPVTFPLGALAPGAIGHIVLQIPMRVPGLIAGKVDVCEGEEVLISAPWLTRVTSPVLGMTFDTPTTSAPGETQDGYLKFQNTGDARADQLQIFLEIPPELRASHASEGSWDAEHRHWHSTVPKLDPGETYGVSFRWRSELPGSTKFRLSFKAKGVSEQAEEYPIEVLLPPHAGGVLEELLGAIDAEMGSRLAEALLEPAPAAGGERHLLFTLAGVDCAVPLAQVIEAGTVPPTTPVPHVPDWVLGVANLRGDIVSLVDLRGFLGLEGALPGATSRLLVVKSGTGDMTVGLLVDRLRGIRTFATPRLSGAEALGTSPMAAWVKGIAEEADHLIVFLDLEKLLQSAELRQFDLA